MYHFIDKNQNEMDDTLGVTTETRKILENMQVYLNDHGIGKDVLEKTPE